VERTDQASFQILSVGNVVEAVVLSVDAAKSEFPLSMKRMENSPWIIQSNESSPQQAAAYLERNSAEALPAFALTSNGAVASPFLSAASCRVSWRRRMNKQRRTHDEG